MEEKTDKMNFFKQIYYSIFKISKYSELIKNGFKKSIYYIMDIIVICSIIYAGILTLYMRKNVSNLRTYLEQNFPNLTYQENKLTGENTERIILDDDIIKANFGGQIIIDVNLNSEALIEEYQATNDPSILFASDKYVTIDSKGLISTYNYEELIGENKQEEPTYLKDYFLDVFNNISYIYYFLGYFFGASIGTSLIVFIYGLIISAFVFLFTKIKKVTLKFGEIYQMSLHAQTILILSYFIINFIQHPVAVYAQVIAFCIPFVYLVSIIYNLNDKN